MPLSAQSLNNILIIAAVLLLAILLYSTIGDIYQIALILFVGILFFIIFSP